MLGTKRCQECAKMFRKNNDKKESRIQFSRRLFCSRACAARYRQRLMREIADTIPDYDDYFKIDGDVIIAADWHMPAFNCDVTEKVFEVAEEKNIKKLLIAGDFLQLDAFSPHTTYPLKDVKNAGLDQSRALLKMLFEQFDNIYWIWYNHEEWLVNYLENKLDVSTMARMVSDKIDDGGLQVKRYGFGIINDKYRTTHPKSYSQSSPAVERRLAEKFHMHIIGTHGHQNSVGFDRSGKYITLQIGGVHQQNKISYATTRDTTHPIWNNGFAWIKDDKLGYYFHHKDLENLCT